MARDIIRTVVGEEETLKPVQTWLEGRRGELYFDRYHIPKSNAFLLFRSLPTEMKDQTGKLESFFSGKDALPLLQGAHVDPNLNIDGPFWVDPRIGNNPEGGEPVSFWGAYTQLFRHGGIEAVAVFDRNSSDETILPAAWFDEAWERNQQHSIRFNIKRLLEEQREFDLKEELFIQLQIWCPTGMRVYLRDRDDHAKLDRSPVETPAILMGLDADAETVAARLTDFVWNAFGRVGPSLRTT